jgi:ferritin-like protein
MAAQSAGFHEDPDTLREETRDRHRAIVSLMEELEAVDWYDQRVDATRDEALREILAHNRDEEKEHAAMLLEWLRRRDACFDTQLRNYVFTDGSIVHTEAEIEGGDTPSSGTADGSGGDGSLRIGSLRESLR